MVAVSANGLTLRGWSLTRISSFAIDLWVLLTVGSILLIVLLPIDYGVPIGYGLYSVYILDPLFNIDEDLNWTDNPQSYE